MANGYLVFVEQRNGQLRKSSLEALSEARKQAAGNAPVTALVVGDNVKALTVGINKCKPDTILVAEAAHFANYSTESYAAALSDAIKQVDPRYVLAANTAMGKDLLPRVAARFDAACLTDVVELRSAADGLQAVHPMYSGKARGVFAFKSPVSFITLRPNIFALSEHENGHHAVIQDLAVSPAKERAVVKGIKASGASKIELSEASVIVSGGRGIKGPENWGVLQNLCDQLGAALGASRAVVDAGWIDHQHQVGQTGKVVSPQLYIACGISGAIQHLAGMSSSKVIVAINKDPDAPIFKHATYGIVGDVFDIVPKLTEELKKANSN